MKIGRPYGLYSAWLVYAAAWLLPTLEASGDLGGGMSGWTAFRAACAPLWPYKGMEIDGYWAILSVMSALSNALMLASPLVLIWKSPRAARVLGYAAVGAVMVNAQWPVSFGSFEGLRVGYFMWWASFGLLAIAMFRMKAPAARPTA